MYQLGWFSTGRGAGSKGLLKTVQESILSAEIEAKIAFVFCSREYGQTEATDKPDRKKVGFCDFDYFRLDFDYIFRYSYTQCISNIQIFYGKSLEKSIL